MDAYCMKYQPVLAGGGKFKLLFLNILLTPSCLVKYMWVGRELIDDLSSGSMPDLYTAVGGECGAAGLQHQQDPFHDRLHLSSFHLLHHVIVLSFELTNRV